MWFFFRLKTLTPPLILGAKSYLTTSKTCRSLIILMFRANEKCAPERVNISLPIIYLGNAGGGGGGGPADESLGVVGGSPLLQAMLQYMAPLRGKKGRPRRDVRQVAQQKHASVACQC